MEKHIDRSVHGHAELREDRFRLGLQLGVGADAHVDAGHFNHLRLYDTP